MIDETLLAMLRCPETKQPLKVAEQQLLDSINHNIEKGEQRNKAGNYVNETLTAGLVTENDNILYPVRDGIPVLLIEEGIDLTEN